jgi:protein-disulfide isomerase
MFARAILVAAFAISIATMPCAGQAGTPSGAPAGSPASAQAGASPAQAQLLKSTETFVRELFAWGPDVKVSVGPLGPSTAAGFYEVPVHVTVDDQIQSGQVYVSKDGKTLLRGDIYDMSADPFAANRAKMHIGGNPTKGPDDANVTLVEFADFQCPHCRELHEELKVIEVNRPQIRIVYKDYPLNEIHPWAQTAALGGRCAYDQSPDAFWKVHDLIFDNQDVLSPENIWDKLVDYATQAGLNTDTFKACLSSPDAQKAVDGNHADGMALGVDSTPMIFLNGRPIVGGDAASLTRAIDFELAAQKK